MAGSSVSVVKKQNQSLASRFLEWKGGGGGGVCSLFMLDDICFAGLIYIMLFS